MKTLSSAKSVTQRFTYWEDEVLESVPPRLTIGLYTLSVLETDPVYLRKGASSLVGFISSLGLKRFLDSHSEPSSERLMVVPNPP